MSAPDENGWMLIETAPKETRIFVWGGGPLRFAYQDACGNLRGLHHRPLIGTPTHWQPLLKPPVQRADGGADIIMKHDNIAG